LNITVEPWGEREPPDARLLRERMEAEGYSVREWRDEPGTVYGPHTHPEDQSHWIISGALELRVGWEQYTLRAGDRDFLPANTNHSASVVGPEPVVYLIGVKY
jgi:quercetin dioxygenase-like cupin family protein